MLILLSLSVDGGALTKLLSSVFHNAVKFTENGKIAVTATISNPKNRYVLFTIADTGEGIPADFLPKLFKAFSREDESMTRQRDGLGLGLLVAKGIARKMGGELWCERTATQGPQKGTEFQIRLPLTPSDVSNSTPGTPVVNPGTPLTTPTGTNLPNPLANWSLDTQTRRSPFTGPSPLQDEQFASSPPLAPSAFAPGSELGPRTPPPQPKSGRPKKALAAYDRDLGIKMPLRILVAEDNKINRKLLMSMLRRLGYTEIFEACDGVEAVQVMDVDREFPVDLILMDLWMPRMDGYQAAEQILAMPRYAKGPDGKKKITVLAVSADATTEALEKTSAVGMEGFMTKPYKLVDLERLLVEYCAEKPAS